MRGAKRKGGPVRVPVTPILNQLLRGHYVFSLSPSGRLIRWWPKRPDFVDKHAITTYSGRFDIAIGRLMGGLRQGEGGGGRGMPGHGRSGSMVQGTHISPGGRPTYVNEVPQLVVSPFSPGITSSFVGSPCWGQSIKPCWTAMQGSFRWRNTRCGSACIRLIL